MNIKPLLVFIFLVATLSSQGQTSLVQFINNCPDQSHTGLDIYIDGTLVAPPDINDLGFRECTGFMNMTTGTPVEISVADRNALNVNDTFYRKTITFAHATNYIIVIEGIESTSGYSPAKPFNLNVYTGAKTATSVGSADVLFINDATDGQVTDIRTGITVLGSNLSYGDFSNYQLLSSSNTYKFRLTNDNGNVITHNFDADFTALPVDGRAVTVLTSGFINPANNSNGPSFGLWLAMPSGGPLINLQSSNTLEQLARIQLIHNTADTSVGKVDLYINDTKVADTLNFRYATKYMDIFAQKATDISLAHSGSSTKFFTQNVTLDSGAVYSAVLHGIESDTNYLPKKANAPLTIGMYKGAREEASISTNTDVLLMHGCTDAPVSNIKDRNLSTIAQFSGMNYGDFSSGYYSVNNVLSALIIDTGSNSMNFRDYEITPSLFNIAGQSVTVVYSGFLVPDSNSNGPMLDPWMAKAEGGALIKLPLYFSINDINNVQQIYTWPNPANDIISFEAPSGAYHIVITDITGKLICQYQEIKERTINISSLSPGMYLMLLQNKQGNTYYSKFSKQ